MPELSTLLHEERTALMRQMPPGASTLLSAGCAGLWYFEWVEAAYGPVDRHLGIEYYMPKPEGLPAYAEWIANTAADMRSVPDASCDLILSGQNIEHLWPEEQIGFFLEAARVAKPGGVLVVDAPNREITAQYRWSHPEHMVELSVYEAVTIFQLAGFDVTKVAGSWLCRDPETGRPLPLDPDAPDAWSPQARREAAANRPQQSFSWWIEGRRSDRAPDGEAMRRQIREIFKLGWAERTNRLGNWGEHPVEQIDGQEWIVCGAGVTGPIMFGPYMPVAKGRYRVTFKLVPPTEGPGFATVDAARDGVVFASAVVEAGVREVSLEFEVESLTFGVEFRCFSAGEAAFKVLRSVELTPLTPVPELVV